MFKWLKLKDVNGDPNKKLVRATRMMMKPKYALEEIKIGNLKSGFREKALKFHVIVTDLSAVSECSAEISSKTSSN